MDNHIQKLNISIIPKINTNKTSNRKNKLKITFKNKINKERSIIERKIGQIQFVVFEFKHWAFCRSAAIVAIMFQHKLCCFVVALLALMKDLWVMSKICIAHLFSKSPPLSFQCHNSITVVPTCLFLSFPFYCSFSGGWRSPQTPHHNVVVVTRIVLLP